MEAAIEDIQSDGTLNWTVAHRRVQPPEPDEDPILPFGEMQRYISELERALINLQERPVGIGHNRPPEPIEEVPLTKIDVQNITVNIDILKSQKPYNVDDKEKVNNAIGQLTSISKKLGNYFAEKGKTFIDEAIKAAGAEFGKKGIQVGAVYVICELLEKIIHSALSWFHMLF